MVKNKLKDTNVIIKKIVEEFLDKLSITGSVDVVKQESSDCYQVSITTVENGLLIGRHGETINSLQLLLGVILYKKTGQWQRIILDVGDYRIRREESIKEMVTRITSEVEKTGQPVILPFFTPLERRIVHLMLSENNKVTSESIGEGKDRRVTIKLRQSS